MFIIHGQYNVETELGVVADRCGVCNELNVIRVSRLFRKSHFYFVPIGAGTPLGTVHSCAWCGGKKSVERQYDRFLPLSEAQSMSLGQILWKTNARLAEDVAFRLRLELDAKHPTEASDAGPDPRVRLAFVKIAELTDESTATRFQSRLDKWNLLDSQSRFTLLQEIDTALADQTRRTNARSFLNIVSQKFDCEVGALQAVITFVTAMIGGCALTVRFLGQVTLTSGFVSSLVVAGGLALLVYWQYRRRARKWFFRKIFLPELDQRQIEISSVVEQLVQVDVTGKRGNEQLKAMAKAAPLLKEVLGEDDRYQEIQVDADFHAAGQT